MSAKIRRCATFLVQMRKLNAKYTDMFSCLTPEAFDDVVEAAKLISGYDVETRTYKSASTALQFGAYLKQIADLAYKLIVIKRVEFTKKKRKKLEGFKGLQGNGAPPLDYRSGEYRQENFGKKGSKKNSPSPTHGKCHEAEKVC